MNMQGPTEQAILERTVITPVYEEAVHNAVFNPRLGFLATQQAMIQKDPEETVLLGWANSAWQRGGVDTEDTFMNMASPFAIDPELFTLNRQGKGTGARLYNTAQALGGAADIQKTAGLYAVAVNLNYLGEKRAGMVRQYMRGAGLIGAVALLGRDRTIMAVNHKTDVFDGVLYSQTPDGKKQKREKGISDSPVSEQFMVVRKPGAIFYKVGETPVR
jgi:hypothetical protein